ncbi:hypothetical protein HID58_018706 [Brassica napus]|uniref:UspA domain-containing protein n=1 Tax=Brassica napus TaxID=3708 RepID=A0ABQ8DAM8_BRANA|nr:hypothetical protein HID58_018706 [Brassica napus]
MRFTLSTPTSVQDSQLFPRSCVQAYMKATTLPAHICFDVQCLLVLMDLETENRIASVLLREAAELRRQAEKDGVRAYLEKPNVRHRANSRFSQQLSLVFNNLRLKRISLCIAIVCDILLFVEAIAVSNRAVETNDMWKAQEQENERLKRKSREESSSSSSQMKRSSSFSKRSLDKRCSSINEERKITHESSSDKRLYLDDDDEAKNKSECLQEEWGVFEKSQEVALDVDQTIFVAVAEDVERSKTTVLWAARNFSSKKICLLYVHRPARPASCNENLLLFFLSDLTVLW